MNEWNFGGLLDGVDKWFEVVGFDNVKMVLYANIYNPSHDNTSGNIAYLYAVPTYD